MSHPNPSHDRSNEYPDDHYKPAKHKALKKKIISVDYSKTNEGKKNISRHEARVKRMLKD